MIVTLLAGDDAGDISYYKLYIHSQTHTYIHTLKGSREFLSLPFPLTDKLVSN